MTYNGMEATGPAIIDELADLQRRREAADATPAVGTRVSIGGRAGVICAELDPERSGTYHSQKHGDLPVKWLGNRAKRRRDAAKARGR